MPVGSSVVPEGEVAPEQLQVGDALPLDESPSSVAVIPPDAVAGRGRMISRRRKRYLEPRLGNSVTAAFIVPDEWSKRTRALLTTQEGLCAAAS